jgi:mono/diheme cytochrome c family protein
MKLVNIITERLTVSRRQLVVKTAIATILGATVLAALGGFVFMWAGLYYIAASKPHIPPVRWALETGRTRSVIFHSRTLRAPALRDATLIQDGFALYRTQCEVCHGAPGIARQQIGLGIQPTPPPLVDAVQRWTAPQIYWILTHGLKMSGMPGFAVRLDERQRWAIVAFLFRIPTLTPTEYSNWIEAVQPDTDRQSVEWLSEDDLGLAQLAAEGDPARGRIQLRAYGCNGCHVIPGAGSGTVGPPLDRFAERHYIAGSLVNAPRQLVEWIVAPETFRPDTAMPNLGVTQQDALDMAAYLYKFGAPDRLAALRPPSDTRH